MAGVSAENMAAIILSDEVPYAARVSVLKCHRKAGIGIIVTAVSNPATAPRETLSFFKWVSVQAALLITAVLSAMITAVFIISANKSACPPSTWPVIATQNVVAKRVIIDVNARRWDILLN